MCNFISFGIQNFVKQSLIEFISETFDNAGQIDLKDRINEKKSSNQPFNLVKSQKISFEPEKCKFGNAAFMKKGEMKRHIAGAHEGKKPYECHIHQSVLQSPMKGLDIKFHIF